MPQPLGSTAYDMSVHSARPYLGRDGVKARIEEVGVVPALRGASAEAALFAAESLAGAGIPILEISAAAMGAENVICELSGRVPDMIVGAGSVNNRVAARRCIDAGAKFVTTPAFLPEVMEIAAKENVAVVSGAFTPTEVLAARNSGSDLVRVFPCDAAGGARYIRSLKLALPDVPLIASGGVTQQTAFDIVAAGATAIGVGRELVPEDAIRLRQGRRIRELARRFLAFVDDGRIEAAGRGQVTFLK